jgi:hypothetical protein
MPVYLNRVDTKSSQVKSNFTKDADRAFDDFCKKFLNSTNGFFIAPEFKQTELKPIQNSHQFNTSHQSSIQTFSNTKPVQKESRTLNVNTQRIKEVTLLDFEKKTHQKSSVSPTTNLLKQQRIEVNTTRDILREKLVKSMGKFQSQSSINSKQSVCPSLDILTKKLDDKLLQDILYLKPESNGLTKNRSEVKLNEPYMYYKSNNATSPNIVSAKKFEINEITDIFNNPKAEFVVGPILGQNELNEQETKKNAKNLNTSYFGSLSIHDFKSKLKTLDRLNQIYLKNKDYEKINLQFRSQNALNKVLHNSSLNLNVTYRNKKMIDSKKMTFEEFKNQKDKNLNNSNIILNTDFNHFLNDYLTPEQNKSFLKTNKNLNVSIFIFF